MIGAHSRYTILDQGTIYRTAEGLQGYYPRVVKLGERELLASFIASTTIESEDSHPELTRSTDGGKTWTPEGPLDARCLHPLTATETGFISRGPDGTLFCLAAHWPLDAANLTEPLVHPETLGMKTNYPVLRRSTDGGRSWTNPVELPKPYPVPLECPNNLVTLADGAFIFSCSTWRNWDGSMPCGHRVTSMRSTDGGATWQGPIDIFHDPSDRIGFWEGRIAQLHGDLLLATCWAHDWQTDEDIHNHYAISRDAGRTWEPAAPSPVKGQTGYPLRLTDDRFLFIYNHRRPPVGVRAQIARLQDDKWVTVYDDEVWTPEDRRVGEIVKGEYAVTGFQFGAPSAILLSEDTFLAVYWCVVGGRAGINWTLGKIE